MWRWKKVRPRHAALFGVLCTLVILFLWLWDAGILTEKFWRKEMKQGNPAAQGEIQQEAEKKRVDLTIDSRGNC